MKEPNLTLVEHFSAEEEAIRKNTFCRLVSPLLYADKDMLSSEQDCICVVNPDKNSCNSFGV